MGCSKMKGLTHFVTGIAAASCFPIAIRAGAEGNPLYFILGGIFGLIPDTIDFKWLRFVAKQDCEVSPDPDRPDAGGIASAVAAAINSAYVSGKPRTIKLNTVRLGADRWQEYTVRFDVPLQKVRVRYGPVVSTSAEPLAPGPSEEAEAGTVCPLVLDYEADTVINAFDGPTFRMAPRIGGRICPEFLPWHRQWSHSLITWAVAATAVGMCFGWTAGAIAFSAAAAHALVDQLGFMGSSLFYPLARNRTPGLRLAHSGDMIPNFTLVWFSCLLVFWRLHDAAPFTAQLSAVRYFLYAGVLPIALLAVASRRAGQQGR
jgi:hypothetical protein